MNENDLQNLKSVSNSLLLAGMRALVKTERKITHAILMHINEIEIRRAYEDVGSPSMFIFLTHHEGYSNGSAQRRLDSARLLRAAPEAAVSVQNGALNLTQLADLQTALRQEQKMARSKGQKINSVAKAKSVAAQLANKNPRETELIMAQQFDLPIVEREKSRLQKDESLRIEITFSKEDAALMNQVKAQTAHQNPAVNWKDLFLLLAKKELKKWKAKEDTIAPTTSPPPSPSSASIHKGADESAVDQREAIPLRKCARKSEGKTVRRRIYISVHWRRELLKKANYSCEFVHPKTGEGCRAQHFLQYDHIIPLACGGSHKLTNLRVLCQSHNLKSARDWGLRFPRSLHC